MSVARSQRRGGATTPDPTEQSGNRPCQEQPVQPAVVAAALGATAPR
jgi:hypothetical protein